MLGSCQQSDVLSLSHTKKKIVAKATEVINRDDMMTRAAAMDLGVSEFVAKPVNNRDLVSRIQV
jgi:DNA-binding response OmpR family regulator